jgi:hypothetical protein
MRSTNKSCLGRLLRIARSLRPQTRQPLVSHGRLLCMAVVREYAHRCVASCVLDENVRRLAPSRLALALSRKTAAAPKARLGRRLGTPSFDKRQDPAGTGPRSHGGAEPKRSRLFHCK